MHKVLSELQTSHSDPLYGLRPSPLSHPNIKYAGFSRNTVSPAMINLVGGVLLLLLLVFTVTWCYNSRVNV